MRFDEISSYIKRGKRVHYFSYQTDAMKKPKRLQSANLKKLKLRRNSLLKQIQVGLYQDSNPLRIIFRDVINAYMRAKEADRLNGRLGQGHFENICTYVARLRPLEMTRVIDLNPTLFQALLDSFSDLSLSTKNKYRACWREINIWALDQEPPLIKKDCMKGVKVARQRNSEIQIPSKNDVRRVINAAEGKWKVIIILLATTGLRAGELRALQWKNLDLSQGVLRVTQAVKKKEGIGPPKTSNGYRSLPISYKLGNLLGDLPRTSQFIFPGQYGGCIGYESLWEGVNRCIRKAGVSWPGRLHVFGH